MHFTWRFTLGFFFFFKVFQHHLLVEHSSVTCVTGRAKKKKFCSIILIYNGKDFEFYHYITSKDLKFNKNHKIKIFLKEES